MFSNDQLSAPHTAGEASRDSEAPSAKVNEAASLCSDLRFFDSGAHTKVQLMVQATGTAQLLRTDNATPSSPLSAWSNVAHSATDFLLRGALLGCAKTDDDVTTSTSIQLADRKAFAKRMTSSERKMSTCDMHVRAAALRQNLADEAFTKQCCDVQELGQRIRHLVPTIFQTL